MQEVRISNITEFRNSRLKNFLDGKHNLYNHPDFIPGDPVSVPHRFCRKEDIEIAGFLTSTISWGNRTSIIKNAVNLMTRMDNAPYQYITESVESDFVNLRSFVHRTFNGDDCIFFIRALKNIYLRHNGLEEVFNKGMKNGGSIKDSILYFRQVFFEMPHLERTRKHISNPAQNSASKRINLFLRWMVRSDNRGVDFGIWKTICPSQLFCPLDVHSAFQGRRLGLLHRRQNDWKAVEQLTENLRKFDAQDPVKYDFALFGSGVFESRR